MGFIKFKASNDNNYFVSYKKIKMSSFGNVSARLTLHLCKLQIHLGMVSVWSVGSCLKIVCWREI